MKFHRKPENISVFRKECFDFVELFWSNLFQRERFTDLVEVRLANYLMFLRQGEVFVHVLGRGSTDLFCSQSVYGVE